VAVTYEIVDDAVTLTYTLVPAISATVTLTVTKPDASTTNPTVTESPTGTFKATFALDQAGTWLYKFKATGAATDAEDGYFLVEANVLANQYGTVDELKARFAITDTIDDYLIRKAIRAASRQIDKLCRRRFYADATATARQYWRDSTLHTYVDEFWTNTGLIVATDQDDDGVFEVTWAAADFQLEPLNGIVDGDPGWPFNLIRAVEAKTFPAAKRPGVQVTAKWGWSAIPDDIREATLLSAAELFKLKDAPFGVAGFGEFGAVRIRANPIVMRAINPYRRSLVG